MTGTASAATDSAADRQSQLPVLLSVNVGMPKNVTWQGKTVHTGVWKQPVDGPAMARRLNIDGDGQGDLQGHGGEQRAVLVYQIGSYRHWAQHFGRDDFGYGMFGENLTVDGLPDDQVCIGDRYRIGEAEFEVIRSPSARALARCRRRLPPPGRCLMNCQIQVITVPVTDIDQAAAFSTQQVGFTLDVDYHPAPGFRVVQLTPTGSACSVQIGAGLTDAPPGSARATYLAVTDIEAARRELTGRGVKVSDIRHKLPVDDWKGGWQPGPDPRRRDYASFADFADPDGNTWVLQEIGYRQPDTAANGESPT